MQYMDAPRVGAVGNKSEQEWAEVSDVPLTGNSHRVQLQLPQPAQGVGDPIRE